MTATNNNASIGFNLFLVTVWLVTDRGERFVNHQKVVVGIEDTMSYIGALESNYRAEVREFSQAEILADYSELIRHSRTAQLMQNGVVKTSTGAVSIEGAQSAAKSYTAIVQGCEALMSAARAHGRRAELESIHDRARKIVGYVSDLSQAN